MVRKTMKDQKQCLDDIHIYIYISCVCSRVNSLHACLGFACLDDGLF